MRHPPRFRSWLPLSLAALAVTLALAAGCGRQSTSPMAPSSSGSAASRVTVEATALRPDIAATIDVQNRITPDLLRHTGVIGTGTSVDESGKPVVVVYTDRTGVAGI